MEIRPGRAPQVVLTGCTYINLAYRLWRAVQEAQPSGQACSATAGPVGVVSAQGCDVGFPPDVPLD